MDSEILEKSWREVLPEEELSTRLRHILEWYEFNGEMSLKTIGDYVDLGPLKVLQLKWWGRRSVEEFTDILAEKGISFHEAQSMQKQRPARDGVEGAWDFWLSQHPILVEHLIERAVASAVTAWFEEKSIFLDDVLVGAVHRAIAEELAKKCTT